MAQGEIGILKAQVGILQQDVKGLGAELKKLATNVAALNATVRELSLASAAIECKALAAIDVLKEQDETKEKVQRYYKQRVHDHPIIKKVAEAIEVHRSAVEAGADAPSGKDKGKPPEPMLN